MGLSRLLSEREKRERRVWRQMSEMRSIVHEAHERCDQLTVENKRLRSALDRARAPHARNATVCSRNHRVPHSPDWDNTPDGSEVDGAPPLGSGMHADEPTRGTRAGSARQSGSLQGSGQAFVSV